MKNLNIAITLKEETELKPIFDFIINYLSDRKTFWMRMFGDGGHERNKLYYIEELRIKSDDPHGFLAEFENDINSKWSIARMEVHEVPEEFNY